MPASPLPLCIGDDYHPRVIACGYVGPRTGRELRLAPGNMPGAFPTQEYQLLAVVDGVLTLDGRPRRTLAPGACLFVAPRTSAEGLLARRARILRLIFLVVGRRRRTPDGALRVVDAAPRPAPTAVWGCEPPLVLEPALAARARVVMQRIRLGYWRSPPDLLAADGLLAGLLAELVARGASGQVSAERTPLPHGGVELARRFALEQLRAGVAVDVPAMARIAGMSLRQFHRSFAAASGNPRRWLTDRRMLHAADLLLTGDLAVERVAELVGYASRSAFARAFTRHHGIAPGRWRRDAGRK